MHLARKKTGHEGIIAHDIRIAGIGHKDKLPLRKRLENLDEQVLPDRQRRRDVGEVEGPGVEGATGVSLVDEVHVVAGDLLGGRGQVVEVEVVDGSGPVGVDLGHVHPGHEGASEGVQEAFFGLVDLGDAQDVVDVGDDRQAFVGNEEGGGVADFGTLGVDVHPLYLGGGVTGC